MIFFIKYVDIVFVEFHSLLIELSFFAIDEKSYETITTIYSDLSLKKDGHVFHYCQKKIESFLPSIFHRWKCTGGAILAVIKIGLTWCTSPVNMSSQLITGKNYVRPYFITTNKKQK